jgi:uncharacterized protein GlcG (DUF336 family)
MTVLSLASAQKIIDAALVHSKAQSYKLMSVAVLDNAGQLKAFAREDCASGGTGDEDEAICIAGIEAAGLIVG